MEVILTKDVEKVGKAGAVIKVKDGFARNFLLPGGLALPVTAGNLKKLEQDKQKKAEQAEKLKNEALALKERLSGLSLTIPAISQEDEKLYGSIAAHDIAVALKEESFNIDKNLIELAEPIKQLGIYEVDVKLHPEVIAKLKIWIVKK
ncbi:MAG: 50S ribosomal protein L9 [Candidatus Omnitrophota bacterium]|jgi:large subunit ribosomal protein L9